MITKKNRLQMFAASMRVISAMTGNPPLAFWSAFIFLWFVFMKERQELFKVCSVNFEPPTESPWTNAVPVKLWLFLVKMTSSCHDFINKACPRLPKTLLKTWKKTLLKTWKKTSLNTWKKKWSFLSKQDRRWISLSNRVCNVQRWKTGLLKFH